METDHKELLITAIIGTAAIFSVCLQVNDLGVTIKLSLAYLVFIFLPVASLVCKIKRLDILERVLLTNLAGISYGALYVICDVILKIPLTKLLFILITLIMYAVSFFIPLHLINKFLFEGSGVKND